jgi:Ca-activated chloride channel homolog
MTFLWPALLYALALLPVLVGIYVWSLRKRGRFAVRYSSLSLLREAMPKYSWLRRHLPFVLFLVALGALVVAAARPVSIVTLPTGQTTIMLAIDVSRSMCSTDILPNRLQAAQAAAISFIQHQNSSTQIGVVAFSGFAEEIQPPTNDQEALQTAIESLLTGRRTAIGSGILGSIDAIAEVDKNVAPSITDSAPGIPPTPVPQGAYAPDIIVLLTDGVSNTGPLPLDAAKQASDRGVRVYTIGFGTDGGSSFPDCSPQFQGAEPYSGGGGQFGGGGFGGGGFRRGIDEETLRQISDMTGGKYYPASSSSELQHVFEQLPTYLIVKHQTTEISVLFAIAGASLALIAIGLSLLWHPLL